MRSCPAWRLQHGATADDNNAAIGGTEGNAGCVNIHGGDISATGGAYSAGICGGNNGAGGSINIYGGTISATAGLDAAGIGGGQNGD